VAWRLSHLQKMSHLLFASSVGTVLPNNWVKTSELADETVSFHVRIKVVVAVAMNATILTAGDIAIGSCYISVYSYNRRWTSWCVGDIKILVNFICLIPSVPRMPKCLEIIPRYEHWREDGLKLFFYWNTSNLIPHTASPSLIQNKRLQQYDPMRVSEHVE
jgi:hypothetical protein